MFLLTGHLDDLVTGVQVVKLLAGKSGDVLNLDRCSATGEVGQNGNELTGSQLVALLKHCIEGNNHFFRSHNKRVLRG